MVSFCSAACRSLCGVLGISDGRNGDKEQGQSWIAPESDLSDAGRKILHGVLVDPCVLTVRTDTLFGLFSFAALPEHLLSDIMEMMLFVSKYATVVFSNISQMISYSDSRTDPKIFHSHNLDSVLALIIFFLRYVLGSAGV